MIDEPHPDESGCGCREPDGGAPPTRLPEGQQLGKRFVRHLATPSANPRSHLYQTVEPLSELVLYHPGMTPVRAIVPTREANADALSKLESELKDFPRLPVGRGKGAVDIKLESREGVHVKQGAIILEGPGGEIAVPLDATSRRFRMGDLAPGTYRVRATSSAEGRGSVRLVVREEDVTRAAVRLDGSKVEGATTVQLSVRGTKAELIKVRAIDRSTGRTVVDQTVPVQRGTVSITDVSFGNLHWVFADDEGARSCYDIDVNDNLALLGPLDLLLVPAVDIIPDPPEEIFRGISREFGGVVRELQQLGIRSIEELAAVEPEDLMHRAKELGPRGVTPIPSRLFAEAVQEARANLGLSQAAGEKPSMFRLGAGETFSRSLLPRSAGEMEIAVDLGAAKQGELLIHGPGGTQKHTITGSQRVTLSVPPEAVASKAAYNLSLTNLSDERTSATLRATASVAGAAVIRFPTVKERIENIYQAVAVQNPGLSTVQADSVMLPENIQMWVDRARTFMTAAGVCSLNDLGRMRFQSNRIVRPGAYVAPAVPPSAATTFTALNNYVFAGVLSGTVLHYLPNDILHQTAVVLAGEWDIRGQSIVIGREVRELVIIVRSLRHDGASRITWELPALATASSYWPSVAHDGANGGCPGEHGADAQDGDSNPTPFRNGGANASLSAPIVTMYILDSTNNLPPVDLRGQNGGAGGRGQDGGRGGNGHTGLRADGTFFGGCCRGVGWGGNGGQGGDGGRGGKGGNGGQGGKVTLLTTPASIQVLEAAPPLIDLNGGAGGPGGPPGNPGAGGTGGPAGTAECETWCDEHPERRGSDGAMGASGAVGFTGNLGAVPAPDAFQLLPITEEEWQREFNQPHILDLIPDEAEPGQTVQIVGQNFDPSVDRVYFDGVPTGGTVASATQASFTVPLTAHGGFHPVVIRPTGAAGDSRRSNRAMLRVLPKLDEIPANTRWREGQDVTLTGLAFTFSEPGLQVLAEDRSVTPKVTFMLPVTTVTRTSIGVHIPPGPLGNLRGVRRIVVRNPDGGESRDERIARISDTIVVRCAAFRVVGTTPGVGTARDAATIASLFSDGSPISIGAPWAQARIAFRLVRPVQTITVSDDQANLWTADNFASVGTGDQTLLANAPGVPGALNFFFVRDTELGTAYAYFGGGPIFIGDEGDMILGPVDFQQVVAHEVGHALCLRHICGNEIPPGTFFNRACQDSDEAFLMLPWWNVSDGMAIHAGQVDPARVGASHLEDGKVASLAATALFQLNTTCPQCGAVDAQN